MLNNEDYNNEEYEAQIITLEDDLGNEQDFEYLDTVEFDVKFSTGHTYYIWACCEPEDYPGALTLLSGELIPK